MQWGHFFKQLLNDNFSRAPPRVPKQWRYPATREKVDKAKQNS